MRSGVRSLFAAILAAALGAQTDAVAAARAAEASGNFALAERYYEQAVAAAPAPAEIWQRLGLVRYLQNKYAEAIPAFEKAIAADPKLWGSHLFLGISLYRTNRFAEALKHLRAADRLKAGDNEVEFWLGVTHLALKRRLEGLQLLERVLQRDPANAEVLRLLAQNYADYGAELWSGVAERHFETAAGQEVHGHALEFEGAERGAEEAFGNALSLEPSRPGVHLVLGRLWLDRGKTADARAEFEKELRLQPGDPESSYFLGLALFLEKRFSEALPHLELAARWDSGTADACVLLARTYLALARLQEAAAAAQRALKIAPRSEEARKLVEGLSASPRR